ncbi:hypothetical protein MNBD_GAMMA26-108 [hydrothermal vent metagenome]|uniref:YcgL domain-containing protein n=1 Tax=hydrothermal vent metagenome TaxID=652676 RepID=A0A3B1BVT3_9ZZZZ
MTESDNNPISSWIYRSSRKEEMFLYLRQEDGFDVVPESLLDRFGQASLVMELELHSQRTLAREDVNKVVANLLEHGFHLQMPPDINPYLYEGG